MMTTQWEKLVLGYKETIPNTSISYKDLNEALAGTIEKLPALIEEKVEEPEAVAEPEPQVNGGDEEEENYVAPDEAANLAAGFADAFGSSSEDEDAPVPPKVVQPPPAKEKKPEEVKVVEDG